MKASTVEQFSPIYARLSGKPISLQRENLALLFDFSPDDARINRSKFPMPVIVFFDHSNARFWLQPPVKN